MRTIAPAVAAVIALGLLAGCAPSPAIEAGVDSSPVAAATPSGSPPAAYAADHPEWPGLTPAPLSAAEYRATFMEGLDGGETTDLPGIRVLYTDAATAFPLPLPPGWSFPADPGYVDEPEDGPNWSLVMNLMRIWCYWEYANMTEAEAAHAAGDDETAARFLDVVQSGYESVVYPVNYGSPPESYIHGYISPARTGDYTMWHSFAWNPFAEVG